MSASWSTTHDGFINLGVDGSAIWVRMSRVESVYTQDGHAIVQMFTGEKFKTSKTAKSVIDAVVAP